MDATTIFLILLAIVAVAAFLARSFSKSSDDDEPSAKSQPPARSGQFAKHGVNDRAAAAMPAAAPVSPPSSPTATGSVSNVDHDIASLPEKGARLSGGARRAKKED